ncbi:MAG: TIGR00266 family protein [Planctomycetota bacterium]|jgi:uncharacterized protein (TIGR00266 family)
MNIDIQERGAFGSALITLQPGESFTSESGAMYRASSNVDIDVTTRTRGGGGFLRGLKRLVGGDTFFLSTYSVTAGQSGEVGLAPTLQGEVRRVDLDGATNWVCAGGSYLASHPDLDLDTQFQGLRGLFSGESLFFIEAKGKGPLIVNAFGRITELVVEGEMIVDTGHVVAFEESLKYTITKAGGGWIRSFLAGEGLVMNFSGHGKILVQSHNPKEFGRGLGRRLPPRER